MLNVTILGCGVNEQQCHLARFPLADPNHRCDTLSSLRLTWLSDHRRGHYGRIARMSELRNTYFDYFKTHATDYLLVLDLDLQGVMPMEGLMDTIAVFQSQPSIDAVCANSQSVRLKNLIWWRWQLYDAYAHEDFSEPFFVRWLADDGYLIEVWKRLKRNILCNSGTPESSIRPANNRIAEGDLMPVVSCFGGLAVYRNSSTLLQASYTMDTDVVCEHKYLNRRLRNIVVNPNMPFFVTANP